MPRNDIHRPSLLDPADYEFVAAFYQGSSNEMHEGYARSGETAIYIEAVEGNESGKPGALFHGNYSEKLTCDHCGAAFAHGCLFKHLPTQELIHVGHICAGNTVGLPSRAARVRKTAERLQREANERAARHEATRAWRDENQDLVEFLTTLPENSDGFYRSLLGTLDKYGNLSPRQADALRNSIERDKARVARDAERAAANALRTEGAPKLEAGRRTMTGLVISTKMKPDTGFGPQYKMLVELEDGNRVWGTVPSSLEETERDTWVPSGTEPGNYEISVPAQPLAGRKITFAATVEASRDDEHFGFYKRPTGAKLV